MKNLFKRTLALMMTLLLVFGSAATAAVPGALDLGLAASAATQGNFTYMVTDKKATITDYKYYYYGSLTIPDTLGGYPVTAIGDRAFADGNFDSVTIPATVTSIGNYAFSGCRELISVTIPDSVKTIGRYAFYNCSDLDSISIPASVTSIGSYAFYRCGELAEISVAESNASYSSVGGVLYNKSKTELIYCPAGKQGEYIIPDKVTSIAAYAFNACNGLTSVTIPASVKSIGRYAFYHCAALAEINVAQSNTAYSSLGGVLYNKGKTKLICCPGGKQGEYEIAGTVTSIDGWAFEDCKSLTSITIPASVKSIGYGAFWGCESLTSITIPTSVTSIGYGVFGDCSNLSDVYYSGSRDKWMSVDIGSSNDALENVRIHFNTANISTHWTYTPSGSECPKGGSYTCPCGYSYTLRHVDLDSDGICDNCGGEAEYIIGAGETINVEIIGGELTYVKFIPKQTGTYIFTSNSDNDTYGYLYDEDKYQLASNDDGGESLNFEIRYELQAEKTYYYGVRYYSSSRSGSFDVRLIANLTQGDYVYTILGNKAEITGFNTNYSGSITIPDTLGGYPVTSIGNKAFANCSSLASVTIGDSIKEIGDFAFSDCDGLTSVTIGNGVEKIGRAVFNYCSALTSVSLGNSLESIGNSAFDGCENLTAVELPASLTSLGNAAFRGCGSLEKLTIPTGVKTIGYEAFEYCTNLTSVTIPDSVTSIGEEAFYRCTSLASIKIPNSVTSIGDYAFSHCESLASITIPDSVTDIGYSAFSSCFSLATATIGNGTKTINSYAFNDCYGLTTVKIGNAVEQIGSYAFFYCSAITSVFFGNSVKSIGSSAFDGCSNLAAVELPDSLTSIGEAAFRGCGSLEELTIPSGVKTIGDEAFEYCDSLTDIYYSGSQSQWDKIELGEDNRQLFRAQIHFDYCAHSNTVILPAVAPTCTKKGKTEGKKCADCGEILVARKSVPATGHKNKTTTTKATDSKDGKQVTACTVCKKTLKTVKIAKIKTVKLSATSYTYNGKAKTPTVTVKDSAGKTLKENTDYTVKYSSGRKNPGKYTVTVTFKGKYSGTKKLSFTIKPKAPTAKVAAGSKRAVISWNKQVCTGYEVYMATSKNGKYTKIGTVKKSGTVRLTKTGLTKGRTYYFKVRAYQAASGGSVYGSFSAAKSVRVK